MNASPQVVRVALDAEAPSRQSGRAIWPLGALLGEGFAGQADHLDRADQAPTVLDVDLVEERGIAGGEFIQQGRCGECFQRGAQHRICRRCLPQPPKPGIEVEAGTAAQNRDAVSSADVLDGSRGQPNEQGGVEGTLQIHHVDEMVRDPLTFRGGGFCGSNVESPIHLHRVHGEDLAVQSFREMQGHRGLAGGGRPGEQQGLDHRLSAAASVEPGAPPGSGRRDSSMSRPTPAVMAMSATLKAGKPISPPPRGVR